ncbi:MAG: isoleucine--tRNA ligase [bacterium]|nr:isoleucine--tRNA ligase [bacterium]
MEANFPKLEEQILKRWERDKTFAKSVAKRKGSPSFVFYEGPPAANGRPGLHHIAARSFKDVVLRYKTMRGFFVPRKAGWDTHGLPVELEVEKQLGLKSKKDIEEYGIEKFNEECRKSVWKYKKEWEDLTDRAGVWLDMDDAYITYETPYIETLWHIIKTWWEKGLLYKDYKVVPFCTRCGTSLSSHELAQGYKTVKDLSVYAKFKIPPESLKKILNTKYKILDTYFLAWTTTPWTLPGNVALAVGASIPYVLVKKEKQYYIVAKSLAKKVLGEYSVVKTFLGKDLVGIKYEPLFRFGKPQEGKKIWEVVTADFVSTEDGTGIVHTAVAYGAEDFELGKKENLAMLHLVDEQGKFTKEAAPYVGKFVKDANPLIVADLKKAGLLLKEELYEHEYPFCWRCSTPLLYYAKESWFISMQKVKKQLLANNRKVNWIPGHLKEGRMGEWLKEVKDWAFSRERYWGTPLPIWECNKCEEKDVVGSVKELLGKKLLRNPYKGKKEIDVHRPFIDEVEFSCIKCKGTMKRVKDVVDVWYDSGAMPFAQNHWMGEKKVQEFPADYIVEGIDQTRGWFYTLLAVSTLLGKGAPFKNVISLGHVLDEKGLKMSKSKGNVVSPWDMADKYGMDAVRWYFYTLNHPWDPKLFSEKDLQQTLRKFMLTLWNSLVFYETYAPKLLPKLSLGAPKLSLGRNVLDQWIVSRLNTTASNMTKSMDTYDITGAARALESFVVDDLSLWYIRRSRNRFQNPQSKKELHEAVSTLGSVLSQTSMLAAPFIPFLAEHIFEKTNGKGSPHYSKMSVGARPHTSPLVVGGSVHLADWPKAEKKRQNARLEKQMEQVRSTASKGLALRAKEGIKVRQPLAKLTIKEKLGEEVLPLLQDELNVKEVVMDVTAKEDVQLDTTLTPALKEEGTLRELLRYVQGMRKDAGYKPEHRVLLRYTGEAGAKNLFLRHKETIVKIGGIKDLLEGARPKQVFDVEREIVLDGKKLWLGMRKL